MTYLSTEFRTSGSGRGMTYSPKPVPPQKLIPAVQGHANGILPILNYAFNMQPDVIFLISDGGYFSDGVNEKFTNRAVPIDEILELIRSLQKDLLEEARIHAIHFPNSKPYTDKRIGNDIRRIASRNGGEYRKIEN